nr:lysine-rich arabinogalactan protein 19-like [Aegilops tauschii subsp. strangulata]
MAAPKLLLQPPQETQCRPRVASPSRRPSPETCGNLQPRPSWSSSASSSHRVLASGDRHRSVHTVAPSCFASLLLEPASPPLATAAARRASPPPRRPLDPPRPRVSLPRPAPKLLEPEPSPSASSLRLRLSPSRSSAASTPSPAAIGRSLPDIRSRPRDPPFASAPSPNGCFSARLCSSSLSPQAR